MQHLVSVQIIMFLLRTAPAAAHLISRAAYRDSGPLWAGTLFDNRRRHFGWSPRLGQQPGAANGGSVSNGHPPEMSPQEFG